MKLAADFSTAAAHKTRQAITATASSVEKFIHQGKSMCLEELQSIKLVDEEFLLNDGNKEWRRLWKTKEVQRTQKSTWDRKTERRSEQTKN